MSDIAGDRISYRIDINGLAKMDGMASTIKQIDKIMPNVSKQVKAVQQAVGNMNGEFNRTKSATSSMDKIGTSATNTGRKIDQTSNKADRLGSRLDQASRKGNFKRSSQDLKNLGDRMQSFGVHATAATAAITGATVFAVKQAMNLQNRYKIIGNLAVTGGEKSGEVQKNMIAIQRDATKYSDQFGVSQQKIAEGYETLIRRGYTTNQALGSQKSYLQGAIASGDSYTDVVNNAASAIEQFGMKVNSVKGMANASKTVINQMAYAADLTATSFADMGEALKFTGPDAHAANQSLHSTTAAIGVLSNSGIDGSQAGTSMRQIYQRLTLMPKKGKAPNAMKQLGLSTKDFRDAHNELLPIQDIFAKIDSRMKGMSKTQKGAIFAAMFGSNASSAAQILGQNYKQVEELDKKVQKSQKMNGGKGYVASLSEKNMQTLQKQWDRLKFSLMNTGIQLANDWMPTLTKIIKAANGMLSAFQKLPKPVKDFTGALVVVTALVGPIALIAGSLLKMRGAMAAMAELGGKGGKGGFLSGIGDLIGIGGTPKTKGTGKSGFLKRNSGLFGKTGTKRATMIATEDAPEIGSRLVRYSAKGKLTRAVEPMISKLAGSRAINGGAKLLGGAKAVASKIPFLDVAMAGTSLIGMNHKNAGSKIGDFAGTLGGMEGGAAAGAAIGSFVPGLGTAIGGVVGGTVGAIGGSAVGKKVGSWTQKQLPGVKKTLSNFFGGLGKWISKQWNGIGKFFGGVGFGFSKHIVKPIQSAFKAVIKFITGTAKAVGTTLAYPFVFGVGLISRVWKKVEKPVKGFFSWFSKSLSSFNKSVSKKWRQITSPIGKFFSAAWNSVKNTWNKFANWIGKSWSGFSKTTSKYFGKITAPIRDAWSAVSDKIKDIWNDVSGWLEKQWNGLTKVAGDIFNAVKDAIVTPIKAAWDTVSGFFGGIGKAIGNTVDSVGKWVSGVHSDGEKVIHGKKHASGTTKLPHLGPGVPRDEHAVVNDGGGRELVVFPNGQAFLPKGTNTHLMLPKGSNVLNARDTKSLLGPVHHANGTTKLKQPKKAKAASFDVPVFNKSEKAATSSMSKISKTISGSYAKAAKGTQKSMQKINSDSSKKWRTIQKDTGKMTYKIRRSTVDDADDMQKGVAKQMNQMHKGMNATAKAIVSDFGDIMGKLDNYAHKAMKNAISELNGGISGINTVLNKFGGGGSVLPMIHYAEGSKGPISKHTMAVVNDANVGPRQEAIIKKSGHVIMPSGKNAVVPLSPGDEVLNGTETASLQAIGALPHYAKGTDGLKRLIKNNAKHPYQAWGQDFSNNVKGTLGTALSKGVLNTAKGAATSVGHPWNAEVWSQLQQAMEDAGGAGGPVTHSPGAGWMVTSGFGNRGAVAGGFSAHDGVDYSGSKTVHSMNTGVVTHAGGAPNGWGGGNGIGENIVVAGGGLSYIYQELNGKSNSGAKLLVSNGDQVKAGQAIAVLGPSGTHVHVGATHHKMFSIGGSSTAGWLDPRTVKSKDIDLPKADKPNNSALSKLVKQELGSRLKWVTDKLGDDVDGGSGVGDPGGSGVKRWIPVIKKAADAMHVNLQGNDIARILNTINHESGGNPTVWQHGYVDVNTGRDPARGLLQFIGSTFRSLAVKGHTNRANGYDQLLALFNDSNWRSDLRWNGGWGPSGHRRFANGGWAKNGAINIFGEAKGENEVAINTHRPTADKLLIEAMSDRAKQSPNSVFGQMRAFAKMKREFDEVKNSQTDFNTHVKQQSAKKSSTVIRPQFTYAPHIEINNATDPKGTANKVGKQLSSSQREFASMMDAYIQAAQVGA